MFFRELPTFVIKIHNNVNGNLQKISIELNEQNGIRLGTLNIVKGKVVYCIIFLIIKSL